MGTCTCRLFVDSKGRPFLVMAISLFYVVQNVAITTKAGLLGNLRNLKWLADVDCSEVFPRGYDLSLETDTQVREIKCQDLYVCFVFFGGLR